MTEPQFKEQDLTGAQFERVSLRQASFHKVYMTGAQFRSVDFSGADIRGAQIYANNTTRGPSVGILVPAADQSWPDGGVGTDGDKSRSVVVFSDNRSGEYDLYAVRTTNFRLQGQEFPLMLDTVIP